MVCGLAAQLPPQQLLVAVNCGDDFRHCGLYICPDLDSVMYALAGVSNPHSGWGLKDETWTVLENLEQLGGEQWFKLGDKDIATHLYRSARLQQGIPLHQITAELCASFNIQHAILPITDDPLRTIVLCQDGRELAFQDYFVRYQCRPIVSGFSFQGDDEANMVSLVFDWLQDENLTAVVICPSNPFVSIDPMLAVLGVREAITSCQAPVIAVSPIIGGKALKGPAQQMMSQLNMPTTATAVAAYYGDLLDGFVLDSCDAELSTDIEALGIDTLVVPTVMDSTLRQQQLADDILHFAQSFQ